MVASDAFAIGAPPDAIRVALGAAPDHETLQRGLDLLAMLLAPIGWRMGVTWAAVLVIVVIVQLAQFLGNWLSKKVMRR